MKVTTLKMII